MKILIATDGSEFSQAAVEKACDLIINPNETEIKLVSVVRIPAFASEPFLPPPEYYQEVSDSMKASAEGYLKEARMAIEKRRPGIVLTEGIVVGTPEQSIVELAEEWKADLIVVGSHGRGFWSRALLGSVSAAVVNHAPCSVLVVRTRNGEDNQHLQS